MHISDNISTLQLAQKLYEGIQLSDGKSAGLITYMRTDGLHVGDLFSCVFSAMDIHLAIYYRFICFVFHLFLFPSDS